ncbi:GNAT family N-acetyltransferase [Streptococcus sp. DD12]|uniref:GNAT family N-acetyltransferase n=1 Tax=Streptococcus sp. DD12 TaxID=1777880 RepID=UPI0007964CD8|nr:GNAT family N-acetyltransferase [Streptococcus sp. DD12]KXT76985.1 Acetyltransferase [Streptococcus sp. DD12]
MQIRQAFPNEVGPIMALIEAGREQMAAYGSDQWQDGYPHEDVILTDILEGQAYVGLVEGEIVAYSAVITGHERAYDAIFDGQWRHKNHIYTVFHRMVVSPSHQGKGYGKTFLQGLIEGHEGPDFRADTHPQNKGMQKLLERLGFVYCGQVPVATGRLAYQKIKQAHEKARYQEIDAEDGFQ